MPGMNVSTEAKERQLIGGKMDLTLVLRYAAGYHGTA